MKTLGKAWFKDQQRGCIIQVIAVAIVVPFSCLLVFTPLYFANLPGVSARASLWIMVIPMALFLLLIIGGGWGFYFFVTHRRLSRAAILVKGRTICAFGRRMEVA